MKRGLDQELLGFELYGPGGVMVIDTGDAVLHVPSGETWTVAFCENGEVCCCGWPESYANVLDCQLTRKAAPEERLELLDQMKRTPGARGNYARRILGEQ